MWIYISILQTRKVQNQLNVMKHLALLGLWIPRVLMGSRSEIAASIPQVHELSYLTEHTEIRAGYPCLTAQRDDTFPWSLSGCYLQSKLLLMGSRGPHICFAIWTLCWHSRAQTFSFIVWKGRQFYFPVRWWHSHTLCMGRQLVVFSIQEQFVVSIIHRLTQPQMGIKGCLPIGSEEQHYNTYHTLLFKRLIYKRNAFQKRWRKAE